MARARSETERVNLYLTVEAARLLSQLAPSENKRGQYVSALIVQAARDAGLLDAPADELTDLQRQLQQLQARVAAALAKQGEH